MACADNITTAQIEKINKLIAGPGPILSRMNQVLQELTDSKLLTMNLLKPSAVLCHPDNRGKLGLNAFDVHIKGKKVLAVGADLNELRGAVCFEMSPAPAKRTKQIDFNRKMIEGSQGYLAPIDGTEKVLSVGGGAHRRILQSHVGWMQISFQLLAQ